MAELSLKKLVWSTLILLVLLHQGYFALRVVRSDLLFFDAQREVVFWGQEEYRPAAAQIAAVQQRMDKAAEQWPGNPDYLALQARLQIWQALTTTDRPQADQLFRQAIHSMELSLRIRPGNPYSWGQYAEYLATQPGRAADLATAVEKASVLGKGDSALQKRMQALQPR